MDGDSIYIALFIWISKRLTKLLKKGPRPMLISSLVTDRKEKGERTTKGRRCTGGGGAVGYRDGSKEGGEGHCVVQSFKASLERLHGGGVPELYREVVPEVRGGGTEGAASHCRKVSAGRVKSHGVAGAKVGRSADGDEIAQVAGACLVNGPVG